MIYQFPAINMAPPVNNMQELKNKKGSLVLSNNLSAYNKRAPTSFTNWFSPLGTFITDNRVHCFNAGPE